ncbi:hypothetical protein TVAG_058700 [Trichomonas vaginalis G3]|uniref:WDHD1/CFT4 second beta-propeller domain-containing protein n=1 Tax=Trichomonas vaginalis (strain ATCC PRA-98 / G3) TaxID=412133 RepID=A2FJY4_TRIV3|nr:heterochromatin maintenance [Trichomonas vaginalis G3]EAX94780.1 hypothetical protein TVAG_058700 [Trichomonas vaginalis G3]KAI5518421.1 heterochromatin maintenance [Trichomonas vaginalis G3]|eukprot:XP_001307710.1 hypothetical protein [Trichomonas vaginalis G3]
METKAQVHFGPAKNIIIAPDKESILSVGRDDGLLYESKFPSLSNEGAKDLTTITDSLIKSIAEDNSQNVVLFTAEGVEGIKSLAWPSLETNQVIESQIYTDLKTSHNNEYFAATSQDNNIDFYKMETKEKIGTITNGNEILSVKFSKNDNYLSVYDSSNKLYIYEVPSLNLFDQKEFDTSDTLITWSATELLVYLKTNSLIVYSTTSKELSEESLSNESTVIGISMSPQSTLISLDTDGNLIVSRYEHTNVANYITARETIKCEAQETISFFEMINNYICISDDMGGISLVKVFEPEKTEAAPAPQQNEDQELESDVELIEEHKSVLTLKPKVPPSKELKGTKLKIPTKEFTPKKRVPPAYLTKDSDGEEVVDFTKLSEAEEEEEEDEKGIYENEAEEVDFVSSDEEQLASTMRKEIYNDEIAKRKQQFEDWQKKYLNIDEDEEEESSFSDDDIEFIDTETSKSGKKLTPREKELQYFRDINKIVEKQNQRKKQTKQKEDNFDDLIDDSLTKENKEEGASVTPSESSSSSSSYYEEEDEEEVYNGPFMPGSSQDYDGSRRFLCWNETGVIFLREIDEDREAIDVEFADVFSNRNVSFSNDRHFLLATLNKEGFCAASRTYFQYRSNNPKSIPSEFSHKFTDSETIDLIAIGKRWVAVATELGRIHIFKSSGFEYASLSLPDRLLTMVGGKDRLFVVFGDTLDYWLLDIPNRIKLASGVIPVAKPLRWVTFDENDNVYALGNDKILVELVFDFGFHWQAMSNLRNVISEGKVEENENKSDESDESDLGLDIDKKKSTNDDGSYQLDHAEKEIYTDFWCVSISDNKLFGCFLKENKVPHAYPLQGLSEVKLMPLTVENGAQSWLQSSIGLANAKRDQKREMIFRRDLESVRLFQSALNENEQYKAFQVAKRVRSEKARAVVITIAQNKEGCEDLIEFINQYYEADEANNEEEDDDEELFDSLMNNDENEASSSDNNIPSDRDEENEPENVVPSEREEEQNEPQKEEVEEKVESEKEEVPPEKETEEVEDEVKNESAPEEKESAKEDDSVQEEKEQESVQEEKENDSVQEENENEEQNHKEEEEENDSVQEEKDSVASDNKEEEEEQDSIVEE